MQIQVTNMKGCELVAFSGVIDSSTAPEAEQRLLALVEAGHRNGIWVGLCGEMAADLTMTPLLVGLGVDELSVGAHNLPSIKKAIRSLNQAECSEMMVQVLKSKSSPDITSLSLSMAQMCYPELLD